MKIKDSGERRLFGSGAVRDVTDGKGRCDLLPLSVIGEFIGDNILYKIGRYIESGEKAFIREVIMIFAKNHFGNIESALLEVAKHYEDGAKKYAERNWEKGIPVHCYVDSGVRHYLKFLRGDTDEPHDRAFLWNMLGLLWTHNKLPELIDLPFAEVRE